MRSFLADRSDTAGMASKKAMTVRLPEQQANAISAIATAVDERLSLSISEADIQRLLLDVAFDEIEAGRVSSVLESDILEVLQDTDRDLLSDDEREAVDQLLEGIDR